MSNSIYIDTFTLKDSKETYVKVEDYKELLDNYKKLLKDSKELFKEYNDLNNFDKSQSKKLLIENEQLKNKIDKMKCCGNCKHRLIAGAWLCCDLDNIANFNNLYCDCWELVSSSSENPNN